MAVDDKAIIVKEIRGHVPDSKLTVCKSNALFSLWDSDWSLLEYKLLDVYLARINPLDDTYRTVNYTKSDLESMIGVTKINKSILETKLKRLMSSVVKIPDIDAKAGYQLITLFSSAKIRLEEDGVSHIVLRCTEEAKKYVFNCENIGYLKYRLRAVKNIHSLQSYLLFLYLEKNRFRSTWEIDLADLKRYLRCDTQPSYNQYKEFNRRVLRKAQLELEKCSDCYFQYQEIYSGRKVMRIRFTIERKKPQENTTEVFVNPHSEIELYAKACRDEFTREQLIELSSLMDAVQPDNMPVVIGNSIIFAKYRYLKMKYDYIKTMDGVRNTFAYLCAIIRAEA